MSAKKFYITTTLPYVNAAPHIGFALEIVQADVIARRYRAQGYDVVFNTGTDEHGLKIFRNAQEAGKDVQAYVDENAAQFDNLKRALNLSYTHFIRTTDPHHIAAAQEFWRRCAAAGDIEKKVYKTKYCVGCELEKTDSELVDGKCPLHPNLALEVREEENYFFKFSNYTKKLLNLYTANPDFVLPAGRLNEIRTFVEGGLADFSISRLKSKMPWGIPVPGDEMHVMYVWFDALINYISTLGWPEDGEKFAAFWPGTQVAGKDNLRQQSAMWQAMLLSAGLPPSRQIFIHGFITSEGQKMSKSLGNVVDPFAVVQEYGTDPVRYYLLREIPAYEDGDFSREKFEARYNADLANGIGNFAARVLTLGSGLGDLSVEGVRNDVQEKITSTQKEIHAKLSEFRFHEALTALWELVRFGDAYVNQEKPWAITDVAKKKDVLGDLVAILQSVATLLAPFLPETSERILARMHGIGGKVQVEKGDILFPRLAAKK